LAEWSADGADLAVVPRLGNRRRVEFPIGTPIYDLERELLNYPRILGRPDHVAFKDWSQILARDGSRVRDLSSNDAIEIAWSRPSGQVWYTNASTEIYAIPSPGKDRLVVSIPGDFVLYDIAADGRVLLGRLVETTEILGTFPEEPRERNLSQFDLSIATDLSPDGNVLLFSDAFRPGEELAGSPTGIYIRKTERTVPKRLGEVWQS